MADKNQIRKDRDSGMTHQQIADKHGVSRQYVSQVCARYCAYRFYVYKESGCIYPNLRRWLNENRCSRAELTRRMGYSSDPVNQMRVGECLRGKINIRKDLIDKLLSITGMTYETLFSMEANDGE